MPLNIKFRISSRISLFGKDFLKVCSNHNLFLYCGLPMPDMLVPGPSEELYCSCAFKA